MKISIKYTHCISYGYVLKKYTFLGNRVWNLLVEFTRGEPHYSGQEHVPHVF